MGSCCGPVSPSGPWSTVCLSLCRSEHLLPFTYNQNKQSKLYRVWCLPWLKAWSGVFKGGGARIVVHKVSHPLCSVLHLPAGRQGRLLDHPANGGGQWEQRTLLDATHIRLGGLKCKVTCCFSVKSKTQCTNKQNAKIKMSKQINNVLQLKWMGLIMCGIHWVSINGLIRTNQCGWGSN